MKTLYDEIGKHYALGRREDPTIAANLHQFLEDAESILNIGAGTGSYEPLHKNLVAVEPSCEMIAQRPPDKAPVIRAFAERLPFEDDRFSHSMTVLSMHHWGDRQKAFAEIRRVSRDCFVALTWDPGAQPYWLTADYFPEVHAIDAAIFPSLKEIAGCFESVKFYPVPIPKHCIDGFTAAFWAKPNAYLDPRIRSNMSTFTKIRHLQDGLNRLGSDLESGRWQEKYGELSNLEALDVGYVIAVCTG